MAIPAGIEPALQPSQGCVLSVERRDQKGLCDYTKMLIDSKVKPLCTWYSFRECQVRTDDDGSEDRCVTATPTPYDTSYESHLSGMIS